MSSRPTRGTARLAAILDALPDALLLVNSNGTVVDANAAALRSLQAPGTSLVGRGVLDLLPEFDPSRIPGSMRPRSPENSADDDSKPVRMTARRTDGTTFPVEVAGNEFEDEAEGRDGFRGGSSYDSYGGVSRYGYGSGGAGRPSGSQSDRELLLIVVRDLSARLEVEAELRRQHKQTEMILRAAAEGVVGVDIEGKVVLVNPAAAHILGFRASELGGQELLPLVLHSRADGTLLPPEESPLADTLASGRKHRVRAATLWRKDGRPVSAELSTAPVRDGDQLVGAVVTFTDRTAYLALAARNEQLTALLEGELHAPLTRLQDTLDQLARDPAGQLWPEANWVLRRLAAECSQTARLVEGVLAYQRFDAALDAGREQLEREPVGLDKVVHSAVAAATEMIGEDRVRFAVHPSEVEVIADQERLAQALGHLIADVATAVPGGAPGAAEGKGGLYGMAVGVASGLAGAPAAEPTVMIAAAQRGTVARIEVRGPSAGGSPVHLPIARGMVERHGGVLQSHELPGKQGRTYVVELPLDPATAREAAERAAAAAREADRAKETDTSLLPELPGMPGMPGAPDDGGAGGQGGSAAAADGGTAAGAGSSAGAAGTNSAGGSDGRGSASGGPGGEGRTGGAGASAGAAPQGAVPPEQAPASATPAEGTDRSRRRRALPAPEVVRPPRAVMEARQEAHEAREAEQAAQQRAQQGVPFGKDGYGQEQHGQERYAEPAPGAAPGTGTNGFPGLIGGPVYPGLEHALPPAGSRIDTPPLPVDGPSGQLDQAGPSPSGRRRRLAIPPADTSENPAHGSGDAGSGNGGGAVGALEPARAHGDGTARRELGAGRPQERQDQQHGQQHGQQQEQQSGREQGQQPIALGPAAPQPVPADQGPEGPAQPSRPAEPFGGRFGPGVSVPVPGNGTNGSGVMGLAQALGPAARALPSAVGTATPPIGTALPNPRAPHEASQETPYEAPGTENRLEFIGGADYPTMVSPAADGRPRQLLVWPEPDPSTRQALEERGYRPVIVRSREEVEAQVPGRPSALFVDPLTGPITRTALQSLRTAAGDGGVPVLVTAGLGQATPEAAYGADPAVLLRALAPRDSERHAPRVLLVEQDPDVATAFIATLERRGMHVVHATSENDAVEKAGSVQPNLVVMDLMLIRRRRVGIVDWLRGNDRLHRTPLVVYTSVDSPEQRHGLRSGETVLFLAERSTSNEVQARIVDLLGKIGALGN
ncbi:PAS domain-containing protein [Streptacidiphilus sp. PB12-B1b]|uniref:hybrid sensor histidine kinase/response regulator n=1 Tax=Streptacidiphilus sp. PB12-B1b TaxID=2705012 RepID=UPI0015FAD8B2|nr:PAS domain-containing protein [Streptacidiphilus sp. PB12-B1b]QMU74525.1 PAS domain-containing protein [Streptacidiphilus sp. PB12-B1b]